MPGLILVFVLTFTVKEPQRGAVDKLLDRLPAPNIFSVIEYLWKLRSFRWLAIGTSLSSFGGYAGIFFIPKFLIVSHHMSLVQVSVTLALLTGIPGAVGTYLSGVFADRYGKNDVRWYMYVPIIATFLAIPFAPVFYLSSITAIGPGRCHRAGGDGRNPPVGPAYAITQALVPLRMRAQAIAILLFILNIIGLGARPVDRRQNQRPAETCIRHGFPSLCVDDGHSHRAGGRLLLLACLFLVEG